MWIILEPTIKDVYLHIREVKSQLINKIIYILYNNYTICKSKFTVEVNTLRIAYTYITYIITPFDSNKLWLYHTGSHIF